MHDIHTCQCQHPVRLVVEQMRLFCGKVHMVGGVEGTACSQHPARTPVAVSNAHDIHTRQRQQDTCTLVSVSTLRAML